MRLTHLMTPSWKRLTQPGPWLLVGVLGALWLGGAALIDGRWPTLREGLSPVLFLVLVLATGPWPWQWTGDDRSRAPLLRGLLQALPWSALLLSPILGGFALGGCGFGCEHTCVGGLPPRLLVLVGTSLAFSLLGGWLLCERDFEAGRADGQSRLAREAQGRALQSQMHPHVLYNALSGIAEMAREDGPATEEAIVGLAQALRQLTQHAAQLEAPLREERQLIEALLRLEQLRLGDRLRVQWVWDASLEATELPPLLLQPLVENALKHGIGPCREGGDLVIGLQREGEGLHLWVANTGRPLAEAPAERTGLSNLRQRLALRGEEGLSFHLGRDGDWTVAELRTGGARG